ncbi:MAG TPA: NAD(P)-dependent oxidoreductase [Jatrophihabitantaceae bacterium]
MKVFLAGATGAMGQALVPQLIAAGHSVVGTTRTEDKFAMLWDLGAQPVVMDGLDAESVGNAVAHAEPDVVIHQMTAITAAKSLKHFDRIFAATNQLRTIGTDNLLAAARATGVRRFVAQSFTGWPNERTGGPVKTENDPFDPDPPTEQRKSMAAIQHVERTVTAAPLESVVLRYGFFYGRGASTEVFDALKKRQLPVLGDGAAVWSWIHVDDGAAATVRAVERGAGIYNVVDDDPTPVREMFPAMAEILGAKAPRHLPVWLGGMIAGEVGVSMLTRTRGSSNAKARRELDWAPRWTSWRDGLRHEIARPVAAR